MAPDETGNRSLALATLRGATWSYATKYGGQAVNLLTTVVLARLLLHEEFGLAGYALVFVSLLDTLRTLGLGAAIVYHEDNSERRDAAFWLSVAAGIFLFAITWLLAGPTAAFFGDSDVTDMLRVLGLAFPIAALGTVHGALLEKQLRFGAKAVPEFGHAIAKAIVSIWLAFAGAGAWSLIVGQVAGALASSILLWLTSPWKPGLPSTRMLAEVRPVFGYGARSTAVDSVGAALSQAQAVLIGRFLGAAALGLFTVAAKIPELLVKQMASTIGAVSFPVYASARGDLSGTRHHYLATLRYLGLAITPVALGLVVVAGPVVNIVFGLRWSEAAPLLQAVTCYSLLRGWSFTAGSIMKAAGRPGSLAVIGVVELIASVPVLLAVIVSGGSVLAVVWTQVALSTVAMMVRLAAGGRLIAVSLLDQFSSLLPGILCGVAAALAASAVEHLHLEAEMYVRLALMIGAGVAAYLGGILLFARKELGAVSDLLRKSIRRRLPYSLPPSAR